MLDKMSLKLLRFLKKQSEPVSKEALIAKFGARVAESIRYLEKAEYIKSGSTFLPHTNSSGSRAFYISNGKYEIASLGLAYLQSKPGKDFDRWLNRISILLSILGGALLSKPLWSFLEWIWELIQARVYFPS